MYLSQIKIAGFKSFLEKTVIELKKNQITILVGPNGCGKSNVFDAVRWAIGEQSLKSLRTGKTEDVIFSGSESAAAVNLAQVHLNFINDEKKELPKYGAINEIQISRKLFRDGTNQYFINQTPCRLLDLKTTLLDLGVSYSGYSFIEQGNVAQIVNNKPEDNRTILEEAAGLMKFKLLKKDAENKLAMSRQNLIRIEDRRVELEEQQQKLSKQAEVVEEYLAIKGRIELLRKQTLAYQWTVAKKNLGVAMQQRKEYLPEITRGKISQINNEISSLELTINKENEELTNLRESLLAVENEYQKTSNELNTKKQLFSQSDQLLSQQQEEKKILEDKNQTIIADLTEIKTAQNNLTKQINELQNEEQKYQNILSLLNEKENKIKIEKENINKKEQQIELNFAQKKGFINSQESKLNELITDVTNKNSNKEMLLKYWRQRNQQRELLNKCKADLLKLEQKVIETRTAKQTAEQQKDIEQTNLHNLKTAIVELEQNLLYIKKNTIIDSHLAIVKEFFDNNKDLAKKVGFVGILGELITINQNISNQQTTPREIFHIFDRFFSVLLFKDNNNLNQIIEILENLSIENSKLLFLNLIQEEELIADSLGQYLIFPKELNKLQYFFNKVIQNQSFANLKSSFYTQKIFSLFPQLLEYQDSKILTLTEKQQEYKQNILDLENNLLIKQQDYQSKLTSLNQIITTINKHGQVLENTESCIKQEQIKITELEKKYWELTKILNEERNKSKNRFKQKKEINVLEKLLIKEKNNLTNLEEQKIDLKKIIQEVDQKEINIKKEENEESFKLQNINKQLVSYQSQSQYNLELLKKVEQDLAFNQELSKKKIHQLKELEDVTKSKAGFTNLETILAENKNKKENFQKKIDSQKELVLELQGKKQLASNEVGLLTEKLQREDKIYQKTDIDITQSTTKMDNFAEQLKDIYKMTPEEVNNYLADPDFNLTDAKKELEKCQKQMPLFAQINLAAKEEYLKVNEKFQFYNEQKEDLATSHQALVSSIAEIDKNSKDTFYKVYLEVNEVFQRLFSLVFVDGKAELRLNDDNDLLQTGVEIFAQPAGKKMQNLNSFSSGERSLIGLIFIFALLTTNPNIFCFLDEVDAALDLSNVNRITAVIKEIAKKNQIIMITHNQKTMLVGDIIFGVSMLKEGVSQLFSVDLNKTQT